MKTKKTFTSLLVSILLVSGFTAVAQNNFLSVQIGSDLSGDGLGCNVSPSIAFTRNHQTLSIGPNFQRDRMNFSGTKISYRYSVAKNENEKLELFFTGHLNFLTNAYMSKSLVEIEEYSNPEVKSEVGEMQFKVLEFYTGIGLKINPIKHLNVALNVGIGPYSTLNKDYNKNMYREKNALVMQMGLNLIYNINIK